tara:strand:+ start:880 stop:1608 length:729 start_codon:yes stop_codon:yes gene_type:complete
MNIKLNISYDGTHFSGWQIQPNQRTIQNELLNAIKSIFKDENINLKGSGRTDSGVHANGQIANFYTNTNMNASQIKNAINSIISKDIHVNSCDFENDDFDARYSATSRQYIYKITQIFNPFMRNYCWFLNYKIDHMKLIECSDVILGDHDFQLFCKSTSKQKNNHCNIAESKWCFEDDILCYKISSNRFLHHMVRMLVGTMIEVSKGAITINQFKDMVNLKVEKKNIVTSPPNGLYLNKVDY